MYHVFQTVQEKNYVNMERERENDKANVVNINVWGIWVKGILVLHLQCSCKSGIISRSKVKNK